MTDIIAGLLAAVFATIVYECSLIELILTVACWHWLKRPRHIPLNVFRGIERIGRTLARRAFLAPISIVIAAIGVRLALLPLVPIPNPYMSDEFSHLLLGQTLQLGRLANPVHPMWIHFETIHEFFRPTYSSMYLPGQGIVLAAGSMLFGHPWFGVLLSAALFALSLHWMLRAWFTAPWAYAGATLAVLRFCLEGYWINSYWGGFAPATGGALLCGAYGRLIRKPTAGGGLLLGGGIAILANTRPFEGLFLIAFVLISLAAKLYLRRSGIGTAFLVRSFVPMILVVVLTAIAMGAYFRAVTGSPVVLPYSINQKQYGWPMTLPWYSPPKTELRHVTLRNYYDWEIGEHAKITTVKGVIASTGLKLAKMWTFFLGPALSVPLLFLPFVWSNRRFRFLLIGALVTLVPVLIEQTGYPHYYSPATACLIAIDVQCLRQLRAYRQDGKRIGLAATRLVFLILVCMIGVRAVAPLRDPAPDMPAEKYWCCRTDRGKFRAEISAALRQRPGKHVVFVHFDRTKLKESEWIYNDADIDASRVVWANDMGSAANLELHAYYPDREFWFVYPDSSPVRLIPYPKHGSAGS